MRLPFARPSGQQLLRELLHFAGDVDVLLRAIEMARRETRAEVADFDAVLECIQRIHREEMPPGQTASA